MGLDIFHFIPTSYNAENKSQEHFTVQELSGCLGYSERHSHLLIDKKDEDQQKLMVIYFQEVGYQRKGMNKEFYKDFENDGLYFDLQSVKKAYQYLEADHINSKEELSENFKKNFIDNFLEGESIFFVSW